MLLPIAIMFSSLTVAPDSVVPFNRSEHNVFIRVESPPTFPGGTAALNKYLESNVKYPPAAAEKNIGGTVFVNFVITDQGEVVDVKTVGPRKGGGLEEEAIRVVSEMPKWNPGKQNNHPSHVEYNLPVCFTSEINPIPKLSDNKIADDGVYLSVDAPPSFPGGNDAMMQYLSNNIRYPKQAVKNGAQGTVLVKFDINTDGSISNISSVNTRIGSGLEEEGMRVVKKMPNWNPGKQEGELVRVRFVLPIRFSMAR